MCSQIVSPDDVIDVTEYDFWLFDLDGTLVDVEWEYIRTVFDRLEQEIDYSFSDREARILWRGLTGSRNQFLRDRDIDVDTFWQAFNSAEDPQQRADAAYLFPDAHWISEVDQPVGIVTHCQPFLAQPVIDRLDISDWFDVVISCNDDLGWKPDPTPVELAIDELGVSSRAGIMIGDSPGDIGAAWNAGLDAVHIERHSPDFRGYRVVADDQIRQLGALRQQWQIA